MPSHQYIIKGHPASLSTRYQACIISIYHCPENKKNDALKPQNFAVKRMSDERKSNCQKKHIKSAYLAMTVFSCNLFNIILFKRL